eukprot:Sspe_Gene.104878::Locus_81915_Transcript_2_2_Confidence_0.500_Length_960::g.104878::m.104878
MPRRPPESPVAWDDGDGPRPSAEWATVEWKRYLTKKMRLLHGDLQDELPPAMRQVIDDESPVESRMAKQAMDKEWTDYWSSLNLVASAKNALLSHETLHDASVSRRVKLKWDMVIDNSWARLFFKTLLRFGAIEDYLVASNTTHYVQFARTSHAMDAVESISSQDGLEVIVPSSKEREVAPAKATFDMNVTPLERAVLVLQPFPYSVSAAQGVLEKFGEVKHYDLNDMRLRVEFITAHHAKACLSVIMSRLFKDHGILIYYDTPSGVQLHDLLGVGGKSDGRAK